MAALEKVGKGVEQAAARAAGSVTASSPPSALCATLTPPLNSYTPKDWARAAQEETLGWGWKVVYESMYTFRAQRVKVASGASMHQYTAREKKVAVEREVKGSAPKRTANDTAYAHARPQHPRAMIHPTVPMTPPQEGGARMLPHLPHTPSLLPLPPPPFPPFLLCAFLPSSSPTLLFPPPTEDTSQLPLPPSPANPPRPPRVVRDSLLSRLHSITTAADFKGRVCKGWFADAAMVSSSTPFPPFDPMPATLTRPPLATPRSTCRLTELMASSSGFPRV